MSADVSTHARLAGGDDEKTLTACPRRIRDRLCFAGLRQQTDSADPRIGQQCDLLGVPQALDDFGDINRALDDAYNRNDAAAAAALFTEDAVLLAPDGIFSGRQHIEEKYAHAFQHSPNVDFNCSRDRFYLNAIDNAVWSAGQYEAKLVRYLSEVSCHDFCW